MLKAQSVLCSSGCGDKRFTAVAVSRGLETRVSDGSVFSLLSECSDASKPFPSAATLSLCNACPQTPLLISDAAVFNERALCMLGEGGSTRRHRVRGSRNLVTGSMARPNITWHESSLLHAPCQANTFQTERERGVRRVCIKRLAGQPAKFLFCRRKDSKR